MATTPKTPDSHDGIHAALIAAQKAMGPVLKDAKANYGKYATLGSVIETITEPLHANGIVWFQPLEVLPNSEVVLVTVLVHAETDQKIESRYPVRCKDPQDPQKVGGAVTYARRYALLALLGLAPEDDDGTAASQPAKAPQTRPQPVTAASPPATANGHAQPPLDNEMTEQTYLDGIAQAPNRKALDAIRDDMSEKKIRTDRLVEAYTARARVLGATA